MKNSKYFKNSITVLIILSALSAAHLVSTIAEKPQIFISKQESSLKFDGHTWNYFHLGQKRLLSSLLWVATIIESDTDHYKTKDLNSWMFLRFNTISKLEPEFLLNYTFGGQYLSIIKDDLEGASHIYSRGLEQYPDDYDLLKNAGYHFYFEIGDYEIAANIYKKLAKSKRASPLAISAYARLLSSDNDLNSAFEVVLSHYNEIPKDKTFLKNAFLGFLYDIQTEIDLNCLNSNGSKCKKNDMFGTPYLLQEGKFVSSRPWRPFRIKRKKL